MKDLNPSLKDVQRYLMKKIDKYSTKIHYIMFILDIISQIIEQEEDDEMKQPKLMRSCNIEESSDDDSSINTNDIELLDECSDEN